MNRPDADFPSSGRARRGARGVLVLYSPDGCGPAPAHERHAQRELAERLAALIGLDFAGDYCRSTRYPGRVYFVPRDTLAGVETARALGIRSEHDLFGGVVPHPFVATKSITHPLIGPGAYAPGGWSHDFGRKVRCAVHAGFTAFTLDDARRACAKLIGYGPVRLKPVRATAGRGQVVISELAGLDGALGGLDPAEISSHGLVLEESLAEVTTFSVGQVRLPGILVSYYGNQRLAPDNAGETVYGGTDLVVVRGGFDALLRLDLEEDIRRAIAQARVYDAAAQACFPGLMASRRNYDVARGRDNAGRTRSGVLEQSWRLGGASCAEIAAIEALQALPRLETVRASCAEVHGEGEEPPASASVYFRGVDDQLGPITKYAWVIADDDTR